MEVVSNRERFGSPFLRFILSGGIAAAVNILSRVALSQLLSYSVAIVIAYLIGMTTAYMLMKRFVFEDSGKTVTQEYIRFGIVNIVALIQVWLVSIFLVHWIFPALEFQWHAETVAHVIGVVSPVVTSYAAHKYFTFASVAE
ncbi:GtrA family protein (plasmid) [Rhizobium sp. CB3090]|uniref:GtrA family protein n=1 Tax=Rhizobium sp. CB3090 TaxID=3039156 RepID=UPI0024B06768|nr:GtrA family protein [Rhizobium sp. CB3090]WFU12175.1 GtrA family protein [Rhizobium sp. CB3090]